MEGTYRTYKVTEQEGERNEEADEDSTSHKPKEHSVQRCFLRTHLLDLLFPQPLEPSQHTQTIKCLL